MPDTQPDRRTLAEGLGIPASRVTDAVLAEIARDPMFLHHLELCRDDPGMLDLLLSQYDDEAGPGNAELLGRAGAALARWAASGFSRTPQAEYRKRLAVCRGCDQLKAPPDRALYRLTGGRDGRTVCGMCGCDVRRKAALATESCPAGRWEASGV
ncbi:hypothetical protein GCM10009801_61850 [Streptomyces albiaxialis]|uniref:Uncharacterized protein n=1 Tax=Streptomyces albiaxialis TaxID=329523 RepID=A0ABN2WKS2_9ACTN